MADVADNADAKAVQLAELLADREAVQQRLGWMLMRSVAAVHHGNRDPVGDPVRCTYRLVPDDHQIGSHGLECQNGVLQTFSLRERRSSRRERHSVSGQKPWLPSPKDNLVLVEASKNKVVTVFPRRAGTFGIGRCSTSTKPSAFVQQTLQLATSNILSVSNASSKLLFLHQPHTFLFVDLGDPHGHSLTHRRG